MSVFLIKPIQAIDLRQNESDGAILVELNGTIHADVIEADMNAITGESPNIATLYDLKTLLATIDADTSKLDAIKAALETMDDWDESDRCKVNLNKLATANVPNAGVAVGSSTTLALAANAARVAATFTNDSDEKIYLSLGATAVMSQGIPLNANGGSYEINQTNLYTGVVHAICSSGSKNLCVSEI